MKYNYALKWVLQRITAVMLIPTSFWFIYNCITFRNLDYYELQLFFQSYLNSFIFIIMMVAMLIHAKFGCETIIQDYVSSKFLKKLTKNLINFITIFSLFFMVFAIVRLNIING